MTIVGRHNLLARDDSDSLLAVGGGSGSEFTKGREKTSGCARIIESIKGDSRRELRRFGPEADLQHVLLANGHQRVELRSGILFPVSTRCEDNRTGLVNFPFPLRALARGDAVAV